MRRFLPLLVAGALVGCGDDSSGGGASGAAGPAVDCSAASSGLRVDEVVNPPRGFELVELEKGRADGVVEQFKSGLGDRFNGYDAKVLVGRTQTSGTAVLVLNLTEQAGSSSSDELIKGFEEGAEEHGAPVERLDIGGEQGAISRAADGAFVALAPTGDCSVVYLIATSEKRLRAAAMAVRE